MILFYLGLSGIYLLQMTLSGPVLENPRKNARKKGCF